MPPHATGPSPLLVWFHGAGGAGEQGVAVLRELAAERGVLVLLPSSVAGSWDVIRGGLGPDVAALDIALSAVLSQRAVDRVAFAGFSDGASYALTLGLLNGDLAGAVLAFSPGFALAPDPVGAPRVWISHGTGDDVLPVERCGRHLASVLRRGGYEVRYEEFDGGHVVLPDHASTALDWWLTPPG